MIPPGHPIPMQVQTPHGNPPQVSQVQNQNVALHQNVTMQMQNVSNQEIRCYRLIAQTTQDVAKNSL